MNLLNLLIFPFVLSNVNQELSNEIIQTIENHLPCKGILRCSKDLIYLDLDNDFIHQATPFIKEEGFETPPYFGHPELVGAHITVVYPHELQENKMPEIEELGTTISFTLKKCQVAYPKNWEGVGEAFLILVEAPELDLIRKKYTFPPKEYGYHITIGVKPLFVTENVKKEAERMFDPG